MKQSGWRDFLHACLKMNDPAEFQLFFDLFFTVEEKQNIASRYLIIKELLAHELTQREICKVHQVSIAQITRGSNALKTLDDSQLNALKDILCVT
ncbi:MAG: trp operon repressor [Legionella sp.]|nr:trp operon repressor [Legionella sp.]